MLWEFHWSSLTPNSRLGLTPLSTPFHTPHHTGYPQRGVTTSRANWATQCSCHSSLMNSYKLPSRWSLGGRKESTVGSFLQLLSRLKTFLNESGPVFIIAGMIHPQLKNVAAEIAPNSVSATRARAGTAPQCECTGVARSLTGGDLIVTVRMSITAHSCPSSNRWWGLFVQIWM